jgi:hypothetical protein
MRLKRKDFIHLYLTEIQSLDISKANLLTVTRGMRSVCRAYTIDVLIRNFC